MQILHINEALFNGDNTVNMFFPFYFTSEEILISSLNITLLVHGTDYDQTQI